ncbi:Electron transport complex protein RnfC [Candidatus Izimaplasma bacterium HR1]|jgi:electron transport complex protein RnfC|uniref:4Fe-4S dicluster domain-containing protein n=1 Tax=Candidatus Izimoplasma sp. HR1 TaxID=1541959 RepID=UPI0004F5D19C|nr:Electron transport complex protein RnfC [Candidatus Izimaplasma bacterium HR1]
MITENKQFLDPRKVYIPLTDRTSKIANVLVEQSEEVKVGQVIADKYNGKFKTPVISTVSGTVEGFIELEDRFGKKIDHVIIENDYNYSTVKYKDLTLDASPSEIKNRLEEMSVNQISVDGLYTDVDFNKPVNYIVINATYTNEPFISTDYEYIKKSAEEIALGIKLLGRAAHTENLYLIVDKFMDEETLYNLGKATVDKGIEIITINSKKMQGDDYKLIRKLIKKPLTNNLLDDGVIYTTVCAAKATYDAVVNSLPFTKRQIAVTGDAFKANALYEVRLGTLFTDIVEDLQNYQITDSLNLHIGSFLTGYQLETDEFSITSSVDSVNVGVIREDEEEVCIKCGDCNDVCPAGILPQNIMDAELRNVNARIVDLNTSECIECGLCTYVCPSKINVLEWVRRAKRRVG